MAASTAVSTSIRPLDPANERDVTDAAAIITAYWREVLGDDEPASPPAVVREMLRIGRDDIEVTMLLVHDGDDAIGLSSIDVAHGYGNEHMANIEDLYVLPSHRRRGIGRRLLDAAVEIAGSAGRTLVLGAYNEGNRDGEAFARALGLRIAHSDRQNRVNVADLPRELLETWNRPAPGYSLVQWDDACPDEWLDERVRIQTVMNDAPRTDSLEDFVYTAAQRRTWEADLARSGTSTWFAGARHDATGQLAGFTELTFRPWQPWLVEQEDTAVAPAHRGNGIGRWLKAVNALRVLDEKPEARVIQTWNDGSNRWMLEINDAMGFRPVATWVETELDLA